MPMQIVSKAVGIDLGTTNSAVAMMNPSDSEILLHRDPVGQRETTPSCVWKDPRSGEILVGNKAFRRIGTTPPPLRSIKRIMGKQQSVRLTDIDVTPEQASAFILAEMKRQIEEDASRLADAQTEWIVDRAVITVPAYFDQPQIDATRRAGERAGLEVLDLLHEPTAAACYHCWRTGTRNGVFLVYDLGGGTFDVTVLRCADGQFEVLGISGNNMLGGDDLDRAIADFLLERLVREDYALNLDLRGSEEDRLLYEQIRLLAEGVKKGLSNAGEFVLRDTSLRDQEGQVLTLDTLLERPEIEAVMRPYVEQTLTYCYEALELSGRSAGVGLAEVDAILLAGGSTHVPLVRELVRQSFCADASVREARAKCAEPVYEKVDTVVALGAAIRASATGGLAVYNPERTVRVSFRGTGTTGARTARVAGKVEALAGGLDLSGGRVALRSGDYTDEEELKEEGTFAFQEVPLQAGTENLLTFEVRVGSTQALACYRANRAWFDPTVAPYALSSIDWNQPGPSSIANPTLVLLHEARLQRQSDGYVVSLSTMAAYASQPRSAGTSRVFTVGDQLGHYRILRTLGEGRFSKVYLAQDMESRLGRQVALKVLKEHSGDKRWNRRVDEESTIWRRLSEHRHPSILPLTDVKTLSDATTGASYVCFETEYMCGGDLAQARALEDPHARISAIACVLEQICQALAFAHAKGVTHGDIKPQNILLSADHQQAKLADFGLALVGAPADLTRFSPRGTVMFLAPEAFDAAPDFRTDVYAFGATLYTVIAGKWPFPVAAQSAPWCEAPGSSGYAEPESPVSAQWKDERVAERRAFVPCFRESTHIPQWLEQLVMQCMHPCPERRFQDGADLLRRVVLVTDPSKGARVVLSASFSPESQTVDYDVETDGHHAGGILSIQVQQQALQGLCNKWDKLGELALARLALSRDQKSTQRVDDEIHRELHDVARPGALFLLGPSVRDMLKQQAEATLLLRHDPRLTSAPWELLDIGGKPLCRRFPMARWSKLRSAHAVPSAGNHTDRLQVLLVADPCGDLQLAWKECELVRRQFECCSFADRVDLRVADAGTDTFTLRCWLQEADLVHYAGHGLFAADGADCGASGWLLRRGKGGWPPDVLTARELEAFWEDRAPVLVFSNACYSAQASLEVLPRPVDSDAALGLAQAFMAGGAASYIGPVWPLPDSDQPVAFAVRFYELLLTGHTVSQAVKMAREYVVGKYGEEDLTWARYVLFGDPFIRIPTPGCAVAGA